MKDKNRKIVDIDDLKKMARGVWVPVAIWISGEWISSKDIYWSGRKYFRVVNTIDSSEEKLTQEEFSDSYAAKAMKAGCLYLDYPRTSYSI
jgi:serine protease inhibitor